MSGPSTSPIAHQLVALSGSREIGRNGRGILVQLLPPLKVASSIALSGPGTISPTEAFKKRP